MSTHNGGMTHSDAIWKAYREGSRARQRGYGRNHYPPGHRHSAWARGNSTPVNDDDMATVS